MEETHHERVNRELIELLNELRVALPGVQVLFAFLLTMPFTQGFEKISGADRNVYFAAVILTAMSSAFLIAPSAHHRMRFRANVKEAMIKALSAFALVGLAFLAAAVAASLYLITDIVYRSDLAACVAAVFGVGVIVFWFVVPMMYKPADD